MSTHILYSEHENLAVLFDSVTGVAMGAVFHGSGPWGAHEIAEAFLHWYARHGEESDPRLDTKLVRLQDRFLVEVVPRLRSCCCTARAESHTIDCESDEAVGEYYNQAQIGGERTC